jgi:TrmH family RNA methyltransferase
MHLVSAYTERNGLPELVAVSESGSAQPEIRAFLGRNPEVVPSLFNDALFGEISPVATPTGILAIIPIPATKADRAVNASCVLLDAIQDAGNLGSILRSAAAAGVSDVFLGQGCAQAWSPRVLRAAMGAHFALRIHEHALLEDILRGYDGSSISTSLQGGKTIYELDLTGPVAWIFGNEGAGLSAEVERLARHTALIPMPGKAESLNVAAAAAVCLFEEVRQKARLRTRAGST